MKKRYNLFDVFTPATPAVETFVNRDAKINARLRSALRTKGKQVVLYGHSGCGKTTLITHEIKNIGLRSMITRCFDGMTFEDLVIDAFDQLGSLLVETKEKKSFKFSPSVSLTYKEIKATLSLGDVGQEIETTRRRVVPPQLTPRNLGKFFGEASCCWIWEDFHKVAKIDKAKTSSIMKIFKDMAADYPALKIVAIGAVGTARQVVQYNNDMKARVSEILIPYMSDVEIRNIMETGEDLLFVRFDEEVKRKVLQYSCGLPSICHQLCLTMCELKHIDRTSVEKNRPKIILSDFFDALENYVRDNSDTLLSQLDKAVKKPNSQKKNPPLDVLKAMVEIEKDEVGFDDISSNHTTKRLSTKEIEQALLELSLPDRGEILFYDENSNKYRFKDRFLKSFVIMKFSDEDKEPRSYREKELIEKIVELMERDFGTRGHLDLDDDDDVFENIF